MSQLKKLIKETLNLLYKKLWLSMIRREYNKCLKYKEKAVESEYAVRHLRVSYEIVFKESLQEQGLSSTSETVLVQEP